VGKDSLVKFSNAIINEAEEQKKQLLNEIKEENSRLIERKRKELEKRKNEQILTETEKIESCKRLEIALQSQKYRYELKQKRTKLLLSMFDKIEKNILEYTKTDEYYLILKSDFMGAIENIEDEITVFAKLCDIEYLKEFSHDKITFEAADENILGGFTLTIPTRRLFIDNTLRTRLEEEKKSFALNSGFIID